MRRKLSQNRSIAQKDFERVRRNVDEAFEYGEPVSIRTKVREADEDSIFCPLCWDEVRLESSDPYCSACQGSGWVSHESYEGYRFRVISLAHIPPSPDQFDVEPGGESHDYDLEFWVNFTERELKDGDLIARVEWENLDKPEFGTIPLNEYGTQSIFKVTHAIQPALMPGYHIIDGNMIMAQQVRTRFVDDERPESRVDMLANLALWQLEGIDPATVFYDDAVTEILYG